MRPRLLEPQYQASTHPEQAHDAAISKVSWAHPEFGTVLASSSFDRTVKVWEQIPLTESDATQVNGSGSATSTSKWVERAMLVDAKGTVRAIEFAPQHFGLKLVSDLSSQVTSAPWTFLSMPGMYVACNILAIASRRVCL